MCIRQRAIELVPAGQGLSARVLHVRFLGDAAQVEIGVNGFEQPLRARVPEAAAPRRGSEVGIHVEPTSILVFPGAVREE
jgi:iron(III) transport system ATP-binding protein